MRPIRTVATVVLLGVWLLASVFFGTLGYRVARRLLPGASGPELDFRIVDLHGALVTAAYSLGVAALLLGATWLVLPRAQRGSVAWLGMLWLCTTAFLLGMRQTSGWPLVIAALIALLIGIELMRRLTLLLMAWRTG